MIDNANSNVDCDCIIEFEVWLSLFVIAALCIVMLYIAIMQTLPDFFGG